MKRSDMIALISSANDQDMEAAKRWLRDMPPLEVCLTWCIINDDARKLRRCQSDDLLEIIARFAVLGMGMAVEALEREEQQRDKQQ